MDPRVKNIPCAQAKQAGETHPCQFLFDSLDLNQVILAKSPLATIVFEAGGQCVMANEAAATLVGGSVLELERQNFHRLDSWSKAGLLDLANITLSRGVARSGEMLYTSSFGKTLWLKYTLVPFQKAERPHLILFAQDVSDQKEAEQAIHESERRFRAVFENAAVGICLTGLDGRLIQVNRCFHEMLGYGAGLLEGMRFSDLTHPEDRAQGQAAFQAGFADKAGANLSMEKRYLAKDGHVVHVMLNVFVMRDAAGRPLYNIACALDISARKRTEEELRQSESRYRILSQNLKQCVFVKDRDLVFISANDAFAASVSLAPTQVIGKTDYDLFPQDVADQYRADDRRVMERRCSEERVQSYWDGTQERFVNVEKSPVIDGNGAVQGVLGIHWDVTDSFRASEALRENEERYRMQVELSQEAILLAADDMLVSVNRAAVALLNAGAPEDLLGKSLMDFVDASSMPLVKERRRLRSTGLEPPGAYPIGIRCLDGEIKQVELSHSDVPVQGKGGSQYIVRDVTRQRHLEQQLLEANKMESIGQLAAGVAHEINTPIQFIGDNLKFLQESHASLVRILALYRTALDRAGAGALDPAALAAVRAELAGLDEEYLVNEIPAALAQSLEGTGRVAKIVRSMKEFSHPDGAVKTPINLNMAVESTVAVAKNEWKYVADLEMDLDPELPLVSCFPGEINQVVLNLLVNAAHAVDEKSGGNAGPKGAIKVSTRRLPDWAEIRVQDSGTGIPKAIQARVFEPFFTTKAVGRGTGQGLAMAHRVVVAKHQGQIYFETECGKGTTFIVRLPLGIAAENPESKP